MTSLTRRKTPLMQMNEEEYWRKRQEILEDPRVKATPDIDKYRVINEIRKERGL